MHRFAETTFDAEKATKTVCGGKGLHPIFTASGSSDAPRAP